MMENPRYQESHRCAIVHELETRINSRKGHIDRMRTVSMRQRARVVVDVLVALYVGRIDVATIPNDSVADRLMTTIVHRELAPMIQTAVEDLLICGAGGIALTLNGIGQLRPENWMVYPNFFEPRLSVRRFELQPDVAATYFGVEPFKDILEPLFERYDEGDPLAFEMAQPVVVYEVISPREILYYYNEEMILRRQRLPWEGHYFVIGNERYETGRRDANYVDLPISVIETTMRMQEGEVNLFEAHARVFTALAKQALRSAVIMYNATALDVDKESTKEFLRNFQPIATTTEGPAIAVVDKVSIPELQAALREIEQMITSVTGVTPYMLAQVGLANTATETLTMQSMSNIKASFLQLKISEWINQLLEAFRAYLVAMPHAEQPTIAFFEQAPGTSGIQELVFGASGIPYAAALGRVKIGLKSLGFQEYLERRQDIQTMLSFIVGLYQILAQHGAIYDIPKLIDMFILTYGLDPSEFRLDAASMTAPTASGEAQEPAENAQPVGAPKGSPFQTQGTPNPEYSRLNSIMGILNRVQERIPENTRDDLERLNMTLQGLTGNRP